MSLGKYLVLLMLTGLFAVSASAQHRLIAEGRSPALFLKHTVQKGENYYSLGRRYSLTPREIAKINRLKFNEGLRIHQVIRIPLTSANFSHEKNRHAEPVYRQIRRGETLSRISAISGHVSIAELRSWNHLRGSKVEPGRYLIVGWLKPGGPVEEPAVADRKASAAEKTADQTTAVAAATPVTGNDSRQAANGSMQKAAAGNDNGQSAQQNDSFLAEVIADERAKHERNSAGNNSLSDVNSSPRNHSRRETVKEDRPAKETATDSQTSSGTMENNSAGNNNTTEKAATRVTDNTTAAAASVPPATPTKDTVAAPNPFAEMLDKVDGTHSKSQKQLSSAPSAASPSPAVVTETAPKVERETPPAHQASKAASKTPAADNPETASQTVASSADNTSASASPFFSLYQQQASSGKAVTEKGAGAWFKSNVPANTLRFYALNNSAPRGTVIRVTNPLNGKFIYVKVLDVIPQVSGNANLIIKISDAAMQELGISAARFFCELEYAK